MALAVTILPDTHLAFDRTPFTRRTHAKRADGSTPLIVASYLGRVEGVEALLAAGAKLRIKDDDGTALQNARRQKQLECVALLEKAEKERGALEPIDDEGDELAIS